MEPEKQWWEKRRGQIQSELMKELDEPENTSNKAASGDEDGVLVDTPKTKAGKKKAKK